MEQSTAYEWVELIPGDLHMKGSLCESAFKEQVVGGFHHLAQKVMKQPSLKEETFEEKKYNRNNLRQIKEAVKDCGRSHVNAAVQLFRSSKYFPNQQEMYVHARLYGNHNMASGQKPPGHKPPDKNPPSQKPPRQNPPRTNFVNDKTFLP